MNFLTAIGNIGLVSVMPAIGRLLAIPDYLVAGIFSLSAMIWAISAPAWIGPIGRSGPNRFVRLGMLGFIVSMGGCALAVELGLIGWTGPLVTFALFLGLRSIYGFSGSAAATATQALVATETQGAERTRMLAMLAGAVSLGTIIGPAIAPLMTVEPLGPLGPMAGFALIGAVALGASFLFLPRRTSLRAPGQAPRRISLREVWRNPAVGRSLSFGLLMCSAQAMNLYTIGFVLIDRMEGDALAAQAMIGLTMSGGAACSLAAQWGLIRLLPMRPLRMMQAGAVLAVAGNALPILSGGVASASAGFVLASFGYGLGRPGFAAAASLGGSAEEQVAVASAVTMIAGASITLPPIIASAAYQFIPAAPFLLAALLLVLGLPFARLARGIGPSIVHDDR